MRINKKWFVILVMFMSFMCYGNTVNATSKEEITKFKKLEANEGNTQYHVFELTREGKVQFSFSDETYGEITINLFNEAGTQVYSKSFSAIFESASFTTDVLGIGKYSISVVVGTNLTDYDLTIYALFEPSVEYPEFDVDTSKITLTKGETEEPYMFCKPQNANYSIKWYTQNSKVASVSNLGVINAKNKGKTTVYAEISTNKNSNYKTFKWEVVVKNPNPSFAKVLKKMKGFKQKKTKYTLKQKGKKAILKGGGNLVNWEKHIKTKGYAHLGVFYPYIELVKKNGKTTTALKFYSLVELLTIDSSNDLEYDELVFKNGRTSVNFTYTHIKKKSKTHKGVTTITNKATVNLSSDMDDNLSKVNKLIKILKKKNVIFKAKNSEEGGYVQYTLGTKTKQNWLTFINNYKKILEMY